MTVDVMAVCSVDSTAASKVDQMAVCSAVVMVDSTAASWVGPSELPMADLKVVCLAVHLADY